MDDENAKSLSDIADLIPCIGCICCFQSCYTDWPECCGCRSKGTICCFATECVQCKPACNFCGEINPQLKKNPDTCCVFYEGTFLCVNPGSAFSCTEQVFCIDQRCACPPGGVESETPCVLALLGVTICYAWRCKCACCSTLGGVRSQVQDAGAPVEAFITDGGATPRPVVELIMPAEKMDREIEE
eukprot:CAMPEP_0171717196 /NCGR_PEP_ID=MMETSP0991-20121206/19885_1 /TAXON_ID=483369 /ORGANISM="non described non described, Strain CCMP2098" /LENGTH=185 /DNA_ID=CAMNT_0012308359 /DNA_START=175 /DNA_END=732 /DNA_ORIENTATION=-